MNSIPAIPTDAIRAVARDFDRPDPVLHANAETDVRETATEFAEIGEPGITYLEAYVSSAFATHDLTIYAKEGPGGVLIVVETDADEVPVCTLRDVRDIEIARLFMNLGTLSERYASAA